MQYARFVPDLPVPDQLAFLIEDLQYNILHVEPVTLNDKPAIIGIRIQVDLQSLQRIADAYIGFNIDVKGI